jgi:hypothetical protein
MCGTLKRTPNIEMEKYQEVPQNCGNKSASYGCEKRGITSRDKIRLQNAEM